jgi:uncharacterized protein YkwD
MRGDQGTIELRRSQCTIYTHFILHRSRRYNVRHTTILLLFSLLVALSSVQITAAEEIGQTSSMSETQPTHTPLAVPAGYQALLPVVIGLGAPSSQSFSDEAQAMLSLTNAERAAAGCPAMTLNSKLSAAAQGHAQDMVQNDFYAHRGSDNATNGTRITRQGYLWSMAGENITAGYTTAESAMASWLTSPGHRANIINCSYREMGVGYTYEPNDGGLITWRHYWVQVFATPQ